MKSICSPIALALLTLALCSCSSTKTSDELPDTPPGILFDSALQKEAKEDTSGALEDLKLLDNRYPFGPYSETVKLKLIHLHYQMGNVVEAKATIQAFLKLHPRHEHADYVLYLLGIIHQEEDLHLLKKMLHLDQTGQNPNHAQEAFQTFSHLLTQYPDSIYAKDAQLRLIALKNRLALHELGIISFYDKNSAHVAVVNRVKRMMVNYPDTEAARKALGFLEKAYKALELDEELKKTQELLAANSL